VHEIQGSAAPTNRKGTIVRSMEDSLSPERMQFFLAGMAGLPKEEIRKAKSLYIRDAISQYKAFDDSQRAFGCVMIFFAIIPFFWPILYVARRSVNVQRRLFQERIQNALEVWKDDLQGETFDLGGNQFKV
jgi:hypothetical protein